ncbi:hypothetical protein QTP88_028427 [Uroleucon formosanum]
MTIHQTNYTGIKNTKNITPFNNDGQNNSYNEQNMFIQEWISFVQSFEEGFNAVNPIYFDDNTDPFTQPIIIVPAENNTELELQENINDIFNLNSNEVEIKSYQILEPASVFFLSYIDKPNIESNNVMELDHDVESNNNEDSSYHPSLHSSQSSEYAIPINVSTNIKIKSDKSPKKKENSLSLLKKFYIDQTSSDSCSTQLSVNNEQKKKLTRKRKQNINHATWKHNILKINQLQYRKTKIYNTNYLV